MPKPLPLDHPAVQALRAFFDDMNAWQRGMIRFDAALAVMSEQDYPARLAAKRDEVKQIFERHCEAGSNAERFEDAGLSYPSDEPEYDAQKERVVSAAITPNGVVLVETDPPAPTQYRYLYELIQVNGHWRVRDTRQIRFSEGDDWEPWPL